MDDIAETARIIYEATRLEAEWSERPIVPEKWENRTNDFRKQFVDTVKRYMNADILPSPEEAHNSWMEAYIKMGWKYGEKHSVEEKTHPDLVPYNELPKGEKDKDAIFLTCVWLARELLR